jgi:hypothetical protein
MSVLYVDVSMIILGVNKILVSIFDHKEKKEYILRWTEKYIL